MSETIPREVDIIGLDGEEKPVVAVEVKATQTFNDAAREQVTQSLRALAFQVPYVLLAGLSHLDLYTWDGDELHGPVLTLPTQEVLSVYDPEFGKRRVFEFYLERLIQAWLRDVAYQWKTERPPAYDELLYIGLAQRLQGGTTVSGVRGQE